MISESTSSGAENSSYIIEVPSPPRISNGAIDDGLILISAETGESTLHSISTAEGVAPFCF
jgi:hypothetical protein